MYILTRASIYVLSDLHCIGWAVVEESLAQVLQIKQQEFYLFIRFCLHDCCHILKQTPTSMLYTTQALQL